MLVEQLAATYEKAGATVKREVADLNQQNMQPHQRLIQWVWSYFVDQDLSLSLNTAGADQKVAAAGAMALQPGKQGSGEPDWTKQEERAAKHQKTGGWCRSRDTSFELSQSGAGAAVVTRSGTLLCCSSPFEGSGNLLKPRRADAACANPDSVHLWRAPIA